MDPYLEFFLLVVLVCVAYAAITRVIHGNKNVPTDNPVTQTAAENRTLAYELAITRLSPDGRRNLVRLVLALANTGTYKYGTPGLLNAVPNTYPLINTMQQRVHARMKGSLFSAERLISKDTNKVLAKPPTDGEYAKMVEVLSTDANFLVVCVQHSNTLRVALHFLESQGCDIRSLLPEAQSLTMRNVEVLEGICHEVFRPLP